MEDPTEIDYSDSSVRWAMRISSAITNFGGFLVMAFVFARLCSNNTGRYFHFKQKLNWKYFLLVLGLFALAIPVNTLLTTLNEMIYPGEMLELAQEESMQLKAAILNSDDPLVVFVNVLLMALLPAVSEELFFRGVIMRVIYQGTRRIHAAVPMAAIFFSVIHWEFDNFLGITFFGMIMGYLYVYTGSIMVPIIFHFINNTIYILLSAYASDEFNQTINEGVGDIYWMIGGLGAMLIMLWLLKRGEGKGNWRFMQASLLID